MKIKNGSLQKSVTEPIKYENHYYYYSPQVIFTEP